MQIHHVKPKTARKTAKRIGRGGKRGKTSGRGMKGQTARTGNSTRPEMREFIKKLPKLRGHGKNRARGVNNERVRPVVVNVGAIDAVFAAGEAVTPASLVARGVIRSQSRRAPMIKVLANGEVTKKLSFASCEVSAAARAKIEAAGGSIS